MQKFLVFIVGVTPTGEMSIFISEDTGFLLLFHDQVVSKQRMIINYFDFDFVGDYIFIKGQLLIFH